MNSRPRVRRALDAVVSATAMVLLTATTSIQPTSASWNDTEFAAASFTAGVINPVTSLSCAAGAGLLGASIGFTWAQPDTTTTGVVPKSYVLSWTGTAGGGSVTVSSLTGAIPGGLLSVLGTSTVSVTATSGAWTSAASTVTRTVTTISALGAIVSWTCV
jgi:hypothetical protein